MLEPKQADALRAEIADENGDLGAVVQALFADTIEDACKNRDYIEHAIGAFQQAQKAHDATPSERRRAKLLAQHLIGWRGMAAFMSLGGKIIFQYDPESKDA